MKMKTRASQTKAFCKLASSAGGNRRAFIFSYYPHSVRSFLLSIRQIRQEVSGRRAHLEWRTCLLNLNWMNLTLRNWRHRLDLSGLRRLTARLLRVLTLIWAPSTDSVGSKLSFLLFCRIFFLSIEDFFFFFCESEVIFMEFQYTFITVPY